MPSGSFIIVCMLEDLWVIEEAFFLFSDTCISYYFQLFSVPKAGHLIAETSSHTCSLHDCHQRSKQLQQWQRDSTMLWELTFPPPNPQIRSSFAEWHGPQLGHSVKHQTPPSGDARGPYSWVVPLVRPHNLGGTLSPCLPPLSSLQYSGAEFSVQDWDWS